MTQTTKSFEATARESLSRAFSFSKRKMAVHIKSSGFYALASKRRNEVIEFADKLRRFGVIYVDFPWQFKAHSQKGIRRSAERHYDTMTLDEIAAYPIANFASPDCVLLMWATVPLLDKAIAVMRALGFTYKSGVVWDKTIAAFGFWFRNQHELLLLGTRGQPRAPLPPDRLPSVIAERRTVHSRKPEAAYQAIERMFPNLASSNCSRARQGDSGGRRSAWTRRPRPRRSAPSCRT
jgi:N6-adenosine-specific RNA methylase IME4